MTETTYTYARTCTVYCCLTLGAARYRGHVTYTPPPTYRDAWAGNPDTDKNWWK